MPTKAKSKTSGSANPAYPDAHPTAPGGMSEKALVEELVTKHGYEKDHVVGLKWPEKIDLVSANRRSRELEAQHEESNSRSRLLTDGVVTVEDDDLDDLLAEFGLDDQPDPTITPELADAIAHVESMDFNEVAIAADDLDPASLMEELNEAADQRQASRLLVKLPGTMDYIFDGHYGAGPSASERWMTCTASLGASREFLETLTPNQQEQFANSNEAARQGTTAHAAAETEALVILGRLSEEEAKYNLLELAVLPESEGEAYDDEMGEYITEYVDLVKSYADERGDDHVMIEARVESAIPLSGFHEGEVHVISGSADCIVLPDVNDPHPMLVVADLKYGNGIDVDVESNPQVRIYALGALGLLVNDDGELITDVETVGYHIVQPRLGGIKTWEEPLADLLQWRDEVLSPALTAALYGPATYAPSETACQFCPARGGCPALAEQRVSQAAELFDVVVQAEFEDGPGAFPETTAMDDALLGSLLTQISGLMDIHKDLKAEVERRLFRGGSVPGFQLVNYTPPRKWKDAAPDELEPGVGADEERLPVEAVKKLWITEPQLLSPTQAEKILGKEDYKQIEDLVDKPDKRPVVAKVGDRRKPWTGRPPEAMFDIEEES